MALSFGKRDVARIAAVLDPDYKELPPEQQSELLDLASTALDEAYDLIQKKGKFTLAGRVKRDGSADEVEGGDIVALGLYQTEKQALNDALKLAYSTQTHESHSVLVLPVFPGTPSAYYKSRKKNAEEREAASRSYMERELQRRVKWCEEHPGEPTPLEWGVIPFESGTVECGECLGVGRVKRKHDEEGDSHE